MSLNEFMNVVVGIQSKYSDFKSSALFPRSCDIHLETNKQNPISKPPTFMQNKQKSKWFGRLCAQYDSVISSGWMGI